MERRSLESTLEGQATQARKTRWLELGTLTLLLGVIVACADQAGVPGNMQQWNRPFPAYRVIDNVYYVGTNQVAQFLITTPAGHFLLDSGFEVTVPRLRENVEGLGFRFSDVKLLLTSHAHIDHVQGHAKVRALTGARVVASPLDADVIEAGGKGEAVFDDVYTWTPCPVDERVVDGAQLTLGETTLTAHLTPGHTQGATTWTMQVKGQDRRLDVVFFPSANINPGVHLVGNERYPNIASDFERSFATWKGLSCDVFLADHGEFYGMSKKFQQLRAGSTQNPFIDPDGYRRYVSDAEERFRARLADEQ
jgi:metallo-beta-lactamase class B